MNKSELVTRIAEEAAMPQPEAARHLEAFLGTVTEALKDDQEIQITGFGKFYANKRAAREGTNPQTREKIQIPASRVPSFKAGGSLKGAL